MIQVNKTFTRAIFRCHFPIQVEGEVFILARPGVRFSVKNELGKFNGQGTAFVTSLRIILVNQGSKGNISAFEAPIACINKESFNQPLFGANNFTALVSRWVIGPSNIRIAFHSGGAGTFIRALIHLIDHHRKQQLSQSSHFVTAVLASGDFQRSTNVDSTDPSVIFVAQPILGTSAGVQEAIPIQEASVVNSSALPVATYDSYLAPHIEEVERTKK